MPAIFSASKNLPFAHTQGIILFRFENEPKCALLAGNGQRQLQLQFPDSSHNSAKADGRTLAVSKSHLRNSAGVNVFLVSGQFGGFPKGQGSLCPQQNLFLQDALSDKGWGPDGWLGLRASIDRHTVLGLQAELGLRARCHPWTRLSVAPETMALPHPQAPLGPEGRRCPVWLQHSSGLTLAQVHTQGQNQVPREPQVTARPA